MPSQTSKSSLFAKYGNKFQDACTVHQHDEIEFSSFGNLPAGIDSGIAQLVNCGFKVIAEGKQNAGEYMFFADGVVKEPREFTDVKGNVHRVEGLRTRIMEPIFDTPDRTRKNMADHVGWVQNQLKMLGVSSELLDADNIEAACEMLEQARPHFRFRTWSGDKEESKQVQGRWFVVKAGKNVAGPYRSQEELKEKHPFVDREPMVNHVWNGECEYVAEEGAAVHDDTIPSEGSVPSSTQATTPPKAPANPPTNRIDKSYKEAPPPSSTVPTRPPTGSPSRESSNGQPKAAPKTKATQPMSPAPVPAPAKVAAPTATTAKAPPKSPPKKAAPTVTPPVELVKPFNEFNELEDVDSLVALAKEGEEQVRERLKEMAMAAGASEEDVDNADTWEDVAAMILGNSTETSAGSPEGGVDPATEPEEPLEGVEGDGQEAWSPRVEEVYGYKPIDPKTRKPAKASMEFEVTAVNSRARTCSLRALDDPKKVFDNISWDALEGA